MKTTNYSISFLIDFFEKNVIKDKEKKRLKCISKKKILLNKNIIREICYVRLNKKIKIIKK